MRGVARRASERIESIKSRKTRKKKKAERPSSLLANALSSFSRLTCAPPLARALVQRPRTSLLASRRSVDDSMAWFFSLRGRKERKTKWKTEEAKRRRVFFRVFLSLSKSPSVERRKRGRGTHSSHAFSDPDLCSSARGRLFFRDLEQRNLRN